MENRVIAILTFFSLVVGSHTLAEELRLEKPQNGVFNEGDRIVMECVNPNWNQALRTSGKWRKEATTGYLNGTNDDPTSTEISVNNQLLEQFKGNPHYKANATIIDGNFHFSFEIEEATTRDSGTYTCIILTDTMPVQRITITVLSEIDSLGWKIQTNEGEKWITKGDVVSLKEGDEIDVTCEAQGSFPEPKMEIYTTPITHTNNDDDDDTKTTKSTTKKYITAQFQSSSIQDKDSFKFASSLSNLSPLRAFFPLHNQQVVCAATLQGSEAKTTSFAIQLEEYKPYFDCATKLKVKLGTGNFSITCIVHALPEVTETKLFLVDAKKKTQLVGDGKTQKEYSTNLENIDSNNELLNMTLTIAEVKRSHLTMYEFICQNDLGETKHHIRLVEDVGPQFASKSSDATPTTHLPTHLPTLQLQILGVLILSILCPLMA